MAELEYGVHKIRAELKKQGQPVGAYDLLIGAYDLLIAAHALAEKKLW